MLPDRSAPRAGDADRERLAAALGQHYAAGRLDIGELDRRLDIILRATDLDDAAATLADLPPLAPATGTSSGRRRHGEAARPEPGWVPTRERFRDPGSERLMRVWIDPVDGSRHYLVDASGP